MKNPYTTGNCDVSTLSCIIKDAGIVEDITGRFMVRLYEGTGFITNADVNSDSGYHTHQPLLDKLVLTLDKYKSKLRSNAVISIKLNTANTADNAFEVKLRFNDDDNYIIVG